MIKYSYLLIFFYFILQICHGQRKEQFPSIHVEEWKEMTASKKATFDWFNDAKYGMFIHWGLYSIPGGVWKGKTIDEMKNGPKVAEWIMLAAKIPKAEYTELARQFNPVKFNANSIAKLAKDTGMKYIVITSKHHDGFALFDSKVSQFDVMDATPFKRDIIRELHDACKKQGLEFGVYYSHNIDWMDGSDAQSAELFKQNPKMSEFEKTFGANTWDPSPNTFEEYLQNKAYPQVKELMRNYPDMKLLWYDMPWRMKPEQSFNFYKIVYDIQPQVIITERIGNSFGDYFIPGDNTIPEDTDHITKPWETVGTTNNSWGYKSYDNDWKTPKEVLYWLIEIVSKGGNYMLNVGPTGEGVVPSQSVYNLKAVGKWLKMNGEAIYGTQKWRVNREGPTSINMKSTEDRAKKGFQGKFTREDFWFTKKGNVLYAISIVKPADKEVIKSFNSSIGKIKSVEIIGKGKVKFQQTPESLIVCIPKNFDPENGYVVKVSL
ncbi:MAG: alpha-L-fucosidase [Prolixibacteraceae bacterium]|nr:alpha-L-fucosidase [Prolixibacteraceae bacterium]